ncbi:hypothetical protein, partial [Flavonifractor plautii]|uniref:hypothetical protein n=1 Tax=Flavonifractor plautii TaxID=292800 RepID=UPI003D7CC0DE
PHDTDDGLDLADLDENALTGIRNTSDAVTDTDTDTDTDINTGIDPDIDHHVNGAATMESNEPTVDIAHVKEQVGDSMDL